MYTDAEIYTKHREGLIRYATALVGPSKAEDVVSTVVLRVLARRSLGALDDPAAYLFRAVLNEARSSYRSRPTFELPPEIGAHHDPAFDPTVLEAVMALPVRQRAATYLVYWGDHTIEDAARLMGARPGSVKRYLFDARRNLRRVLS
jgi:DNA-directed RNA polymerase specialized sigma24 family protein